MHRVVLQFPIKNLINFGDGFGGIIRVRPDPTRSNLSGALGFRRIGPFARPDGIAGFSPLGQGLLGQTEEDQPKVFLHTPVEFQGDKVKIIAIGEAKEIKKLLKQAEKTGLSFKVLSLTNIRFQADSPISSLTERQRRLLVAAYEYGYYEVPRKIRSEELARKFRLGKSTVVEHLRKAERHLLQQILGT